MARTITEMVNSIPKYFITKIVLKIKKKSKNVTLWVYEDKQLPGEKNHA